MKNLLPSKIIYISNYGAHGPYDFIAKRGHPDYELYADDRIIFEPSVLVLPDWQRPFPPEYLADLASWGFHVPEIKYIRGTHRDIVKTILESNELMDWLREKIAYGYELGFWMFNETIEKLRSKLDITSPQLFPPSKFATRIDSKIGARETITKELQSPDAMVEGKICYSQEAIQSAVKQLWPCIIKPNDSWGAVGQIKPSSKEYEISQLDPLFWRDGCVVERLINVKSDPSLQYLIRDDGAHLIGSTDQFITGGTWNGTIIPALQDTKPLENIADKILPYLQQNNYRGIVGFDFIIDQHDRVYLCEINARETINTPVFYALSKFNKSHASGRYYLLKKRLSYSQLKSILGEHALNEYSSGIIPLTVRNLYSREPHVFLIALGDSAEEVLNYKTLMDQKMQPFI